MATRRFLGRCVWWVLFCLFVCLRALAGSAPPPPPIPPFCIFTKAPRRGVFVGLLSAAPRASRRRSPAAAPPPFPRAPFVFPGGGFSRAATPPLCFWAARRSRSSHGLQPTFAPPLCRGRRRRTPPPFSLKSPPSPPPPVRARLRPPGAALRPPPLVPPTLPAFTPCIYWPAFAPHPPRPPIFIWRIHDHVLRMSPRLSLSLSKGRCEWQRRLFFCFLFFCARARDRSFKLRRK